MSAYQEKRGTRLKSTKLEIKRKGYNRQCRNTKDYKDYCEQLYGNKIDNLEEMDRSLEKFSLPRLNREEIEIMNNQITSPETTADIKTLRKKQKLRSR